QVQISAIPLLVFFEIPTGLLGYSLANIAASAKGKAHIAWRIKTCFVEQRCVGCHTNFPTTVLSPIPAVWLIQGHVDKEADVVGAHPAGIFQFTLDDAEAFVQLFVEIVA